MSVIDVQIAFRFVALVCQQQSWKFASSVKNICTLFVGCVCVCVWACLCVCVEGYYFVWVCVWVYLCVGVWVCVWLFLCVGVGEVCVVCLCGCACIFVCSCVLVCLWCVCLSSFNCVFIYRAQTCKWLLVLVRKFVQFC